MSHSPAPFSCVYTPEFPELLAELNCSLVISTYQAGKIIVISSKDADTLVQLPRTMDKPMGMAADEARLAVATRTAVIVHANAPDLAPGYPRQPETYDALFIPQALYLTSELDLHDLAYLPDGRLLGVNTRFSCLALVTDRFSYTPVWQPPFISVLAPDDRCHLNGMAMLDGRPRYATALGATDNAGGWRAKRLNGGVLLDVHSGEIALSELPMPHSPRMYDGQLYMLLSATGQLVQVDPGAGRYQVIAQLPGFVRGLARRGDYLFIGASRLRANRTFGDLPIARAEPFVGVIAVHLPSGKLAGSIRYISSCEEIYDVQILPGIRRPGIVGLDTPLYEYALTSPQSSYWGQPPDGEAIPT